MSKFINFKQFKELQESAKNGNEMAKNIIDKYMEDSPDMDSIGRLMEEYYGNAPIDVMEKVTEATEAPIEEPKEEEPEIEAEEQEKEIEIEEPHEEPSEYPVDLTEELDGELDGLFDDDQFDDISFRDFLEKKRKDGIRAKKNAGYFSAFDKGGRDAYLARKKGDYGRSFDGRRRQIERGYGDLSNALGKYSEMLVDMPEDIQDFNSDKANTAYEKFVGDDVAMSAFGRSWDEADMNAIKLVLETLVQEYGKKNVIAMMNTIKGDADGWKSYANGKIDNAIANYGKNLDSLLK